MTDNKKIDDRIIRLWDFDGVLFINPEHNYLDEKLKDLYVLFKYELEEEANLIFDDEKYENILFTGRGYFQMERILSILGKRGYIFSKSIFWLRDRYKYPAFNPKIDINEYFNNYYKWKREIIRDYVKKFKNVIVIDDSETVIQIAKEENAKGILFNIKFEDPHKDKYYIDIDKIKDLLWRFDCKVDKFAVDTRREGLEVEVKEDKIVDIRTIPRIFLEIEGEKEPIALKDVKDLENYLEPLKSIPKILKLYVII